MTPTLLCALALAVLPVRDPVHSAAVCERVVATAERAAVNPRLAIAVAWVESRLRADVTSPRGATGPMQVIRRCWRCAAAWTDTECGMVALRRLVERHGVRKGLCRYAMGGKGGDGCAYQAKVERAVEAMR